ncbi:MAG: dihydrolipoyl dehydrogenase [Planctomycetes bacterium RBG_13_62_9]|nr:MAG: dihydrolipoyl dehydrogenase [Planctomycetes bacterium RBG_13_62_9]
MAGNDRRQLVVVGAGPGGYAAAFVAAQLGLKVTLIDKEVNPGGVCLYRGCIPSKALLHVAKVIADAERAAEWGVEFRKPKIDIDKVRAWKNEVVAKLTKGLGLLSKQWKVEYIQGEAAFLDSNTVRVKKKRAGTEEISFEQGIIATGSYSASLPAIPTRSKHVMDSEGALALEDIPKAMLVVGGGYIGLEQADAYSRLGSKVSIVEVMPQLMPGGDPELVSILHQQFEKRFESIMLKTKVAEAKEQKNGIRIRFEGEDVGKKEAVYDKVLVAVGRKPNSADLGLEKTKVRLDEKGYVKIDNRCRTDDPSLFAIGDVTPGLQLAHRANHQGIVAAEVAAGRDAVFEPRAIPFVEYTDPELAECGLSEVQAKAQNIPYKVAKFPWQASGRAATLGASVGLTKIIIDPDSGRILGVGIVGPDAGELIPEATLAIEMGAVTMDIAMTIHPHPTLSETFMEAAARSLNRSIHIGSAR